MISRSLGETQDIAAKFVSELAPGERATVIALKGDLGSGKTSFAQGVAKALGVAETVQSPTFVIEKLYEAVHPHFKKLVHIDAYRLESADELRKIGWEDVERDPGNLILVEWPERVAGIAQGAREIRFEFISESERAITIDG